METYTLIGTIICIVMIVSGYKSIREPESRFLRMAAWVSTAILGIFLFFINVGNEDKGKDMSMKDKEIRAYVSAMKETENFLLRIPEVKQVKYSSSEGELKITVMVSTRMGDDDILEFKEEIAREFLHNLIDESEKPEDFLIIGGGKLNIELLTE